MIHIFEYTELIEDILNRPFGVLLIIGGLSFLLIAVFFKIGEIQNRIAKLTAILMGIFLTLTGILFHLTSPMHPKFSPLVEVVPDVREASDQTAVKLPPLVASSGLIPEPTEISKEKQTEHVKKALLSCIQVSDFEFVWNTKGVESKEKASFYRPLAPAGYKIFGHYVQGDFHQPKGKVIAVKVLSESDKDGYLTYPLEYECIWRDTNSNGAVWRPIPPPGYVSLGNVATAAYLKPDRREVVCVKNSLVTEGKRGKLMWGNTSGNTLSSVRVYSVLPQDATEGMGLNLFQGYGRSGFRKSGYFSMPVLKKAYVQDVN